jgi:hypothetical protein
VTDHAELIERALAAVEADRADLARGHDGRSCLRQSEGAALAAALAAEKERAVTGVWLRGGENEVTVLIEIAGEWREAITEFMPLHGNDGTVWPISHIKEL